MINSQVHLDHTPSEEETQKRGSVFDHDNDMTSSMGCMGAWASEIENNVHGALGDTERPQLDKDSTNSPSVSANRPHLESRPVEDFNQPRATNEDHRNSVKHHSVKSANTDTNVDVSSYLDRHE